MSKPKELKTARWDAHWASAPHESPQWAATDRGWLFVEGEGTSRAHYLDYGKDHLRSGHEWCKPGKCICRKGNPGNVHVVLVGKCSAKYCRSVKEAMRWTKIQLAKELVIEDFQPELLSVN